MDRNGVGHRGALPQNNGQFWFDQLERQLLIAIRASATETLAKVEQIGASGRVGVQLCCVVSSALNI